MSHATALPRLADSPAPAAIAARLEVSVSPPVHAHGLSHDELPVWARRALTGTVLLAHLGAVWALLQVDAVRQAVLESAPIMISLLAPPVPDKPVPPPPAPAPKVARPAATPLIIAAPSPTAATPVFEAPAPEPLRPAPVQAVAPALYTAPSPTPATSPALKVIAPGAVRYLLEPKLVVPLLSRRAGEQGLVQLRVVVDAKGQLREASVKKTSGYARLDSQALLDIRSARFVPQTENGQAIEWETTALLSYELDN